MKASLKTAAAIATIAALAAVAVSVVSASAKGPKQITAVTHTMNHPDTTSVSGSCTVSSPGGPVWAYDNLSLRLVVTPGANTDEYSVTIYANGSFAAFSNPITGDCYSGHGGVDGWYTLDVVSPTAPDPANLPAQVPSDETQGEIVAQLFGGDATSINGLHYGYTYKKVDGQKYTQVG